MKKIFYLFVLISLGACQSNQPEIKVLKGPALGTGYHIKFFSKSDFNAQQGVDSIFKAVNASMSNYQKNTTISRLNAGDTTVKVGPMFRDVFLLSKEIYKKTKGYFDPTIGDVVNAYGFGAQDTNVELTKDNIDSLMEYVGFNMVSISDDNQIIREMPEIYLDFNAIAKGYTVDRLGLFLESQGVKNYLVVVGGEVRTKGTNLASENSWLLGIDDPRIATQGRELYSVVKVKNKGLATSGNYRKHRYDSITNQRYVHIINPLTGLAEKRHILSASVLAKNCAIADGYATAFMAMGIDKAIALSKKLDNIEVYFIYDEKGEFQTYASDGFKAIIKQKEN